MIFLNRKEKMHPQIADLTAPQPAPSLARRRFLPSAAVEACTTFRDAVRLAWEHRSIPGMKQRTLAELCDLYAPHVSSYLHADPVDRKGRQRLDLPADRIAAFSRVVGNDVVMQFMCRQLVLNLMEEYQAQRSA